MTNNKIPPHANAESHRKLMEQLRKMTSAEVLQTAIDAGIYNEDGSLTEQFGGEPFKKSE
jgi:hypothetical protein